MLPQKQYYIYWFSLSYLGISMTYLHSICRESQHTSYTAQRREPVCLSDNTENLSGIFCQNDCKLCWVDLIWSVCSLTSFLKVILTVTMEWENTPTRWTSKTIIFHQIKELTNESHWLGQDKTCQEIYNYPHKQQGQARGEEEETGKKGNVGN